MRVVLAFGLVCYCAVLMGADQKPDKSKEPTHPCKGQAAPTSENGPELSKKQICELVTCIGANISAPDFKCKIMAVNPNKAADIFGKKDWYALGQGAVTLANWTVIKAALSQAVGGNKITPPTWDSPTAGLSAKLPKCSATWTAGSYVLLMFFDTETLLVFQDGTLKGHRRIVDNAPWRDILTNAGISLPPKSASSSS